MVTGTPAIIPVMNILHTKDITVTRIRIYIYFKLYLYVLPYLLFCPDEGHLGGTKQ